MYIKYMYQWFTIYMTAVLKFGHVPELPKELLRNTDSWTHLWGIKWWNWVGGGGWVSIFKSLSVQLGLGTISNLFPYLE